MARPSRQLRERAADRRSTCTPTEIAYVVRAELDRIAGHGGVVTDVSSGYERAWPEYDETRQPLGFRAAPGPSSIR